MLSYLFNLYLKSSCFFYEENPTEKEIQLKSDLKMRGEDAIDDEVGRGVDEDEQVRDRVQRDEVEWRTIEAARAHAVPYVVGTEEGLEVKYICTPREWER